MSAVAIPVWNALGLLPPVDPADPISLERSPYPVSLRDLVMRFSTSSERMEILRGFLEYRVELHRLGLVEGFQWLNGSFTEHIELIERRHPGDIDVVTFVQTPADFAPGPDDLHLFDHDAVKARFKVDSYFIEPELLTHRELAFSSAYWYGLFSHRRTQAWKGFLQIDLAPDEDADAAAWLSGRLSQGGGV
jgi:hypothetical protein